jgi:hypothetical protein
MQGISARQTKLGFNVLRVHYSADPDKDPQTPQGRRWMEEAKKGMADARWRQEHEIDYGALGGQLVFPEFDESIHFGPLDLPLSPDRWTVWLACDPHPRRAHAFVWLAINRYGDMVIPWSWWPQDVNEEREQQGKNRLLIREYTEALRDVEKAALFPASYMELMDQAGKNFNSDEEHNFFDAYEAEGVAFQPAKKNREYAGYGLISKALTPTKFVVGNEEQFKPQLTIMRGCGYNDELVRQFKMLRFREFKGNVEDKDPPSEPMDKERHLIDCVSYILLDGPMFIDRTKRQADYDPIYPAIGY